MIFGFVNLNIMKSLLFIIVLFSSASLFSQNRIYGVITDKKNNPIIGARITIPGTYDGGITNTNGAYSFLTTQKDSTTLLIQFMGYEPYTTILFIKEKDIEVKAMLREKFNELNAVTITAGAFEAGDKKKANLLTSLDMVTTPGASGNVVNALQFLPGTSQNGESGKLFVRGGSSNESSTFD